MKCTNCGGTLDIRFDDGACPYCGAVQTLSQEHRDALAADGRLRRQREWLAEEARAEEAGRRARVAKQARDREEELRRLKNMCVYCGGKIGVTGKCKFCRRLNIRAAIRLYMAVIAVLAAAAVAMLIAGLTIENNDSIKRLIPSLRLRQCLYNDINYFTDFDRLIAQNSPHMLHSA
ncbi:MAG: hypothetical protein LBH93_08515 [Chitinispirillales bacterium]|nr:hypothetical protein [Chitinispirillales bacterium]